MSGHSSPPLPRNTGISCYKASSPNAVFHSYHTSLAQFAI
jgi:hypothetical protein